MSGEGARAHLAGPNALRAPRTGGLRPARLGRRRSARRGAPAPSPQTSFRSARRAARADTARRHRGRRGRARAVRAELGDCRRPLCEQRRTWCSARAPRRAVVFVGEGPGEEEDRSGRPFVGRAGELLTKMIEAVGWRREDVYICNIVKCRPPGNRDPAPIEVATCEPFLHKQLHAIAPAAIVTLGKPAISALLGRTVAITRIRGGWLEWQGIPVMPTYHPAYLLRNYTRETRQAVWDDLRAVRERVEAPAS